MMRDRLVQGEDHARVSAEKARAQGGLSDSPQKSNDVETLSHTRLRQPRHKTAGRVRVRTSETP
jgi:hypothetical protein